MNDQEFLQRLRLDRSAAKHSVGSPLDAATPRPPSIPEELFHFYGRANGVRFWVDADENGFFALLPMEAVGTPVREVMLGSESSKEAHRNWPDQIIALSRHIDGKYFLALDTRNGRYIEADPFMDPKTISRSWTDVLDWIWTHWVEAMRDEEGA